MLKIVPEVPADAKSWRLIPVAQASRRMGPERICAVNVKSVFKYKFNLVIFFDIC
jgi:hypothetical protein